MASDDVKIGLEVHVQLKTATKLFCSCPTIADEPNTAICPTCLGHPGSKPVLNAKALEFATKLALALGCTITPHMTFSRKIYFYPDQSKNYQITQHETPLGSTGCLALTEVRATVDAAHKTPLAVPRIVTINRVHMEEDPGALIHEQNNCLIDYNRSGIPLCEIVTAPDMRHASEAEEFMEKLAHVLTYLGIFDINTCVIKADVNVSVREKNFQRVEIKNITGFKEIYRAILFEIERQKREEVKKETRGWSAERGVTYHMRSKESEEDYGYITEPDLPTFMISQDWIKQVKATIPELGETRAKRWVVEWRVDTADAKILSADLEIANLFEHIVKKNVDPIFAGRWVRREVLRILNDKKTTLDKTHFTADNLAELFSLLTAKKITDRIGQRIVEQLADKNFSPAAYVREQKLEAVSDEGALKKACEEAIAKNAKAVEDYKKGNEKSIMFLVGQVMKMTGGKAAPNVVKELLTSLLK